MKKIWRVICVAVFVFGAVSVFQAQKRTTSLQGASQTIDVSDTEQAQAFVVEYIDSTVTSGGIVSVTGSTTRYVKADGEWRIILRRGIGNTVSSEQTEVAVYGGTPEGVFKKGNEAARTYVSASSDQRILQLYRSHNYLRHHPEFVRTDEVAGLTVYVMRVFPDRANAGQWEEISYSPKTGLTILRSVKHMSDGSEMRHEAQTVEFKEVPEDLNHDLKDLPIAKEKKSQENQ